MTSPDLDHLAAIAAESRRFADAAAGAAERGPEARATMVPACPDWSFDDLVWHLSEVQHFWGSIVGEGLPGPEAYDPPERPDPAGLAAFFTRVSERLVEILTGPDADQACWSWHPDGHRVGWVRRRQAHEALIHRVDAEQTLAAAGGPAPGPIDPELAADGVDEILRGMLDVGELPAWGRWVPDGSTARLTATTGRNGPDPSWTIALGRVVGTDRSGEEQDLVALQVLDEAAGQPGEPDLAITGPASVVDLWVWGRAPATDLQLVGDVAVADRLRDCARVQ